MYFFHLNVINTMKFPQAGRNVVYLLLQFVWVAWVIHPRVLFSCYLLFLLLFVYSQGILEGQSPMHRFLVLECLIFKNACSQPLQTVCCPFAPPGSILCCLSTLTPNHGIMGWAHVLLRNCGFWVLYEMEFCNMGWNPATLVSCFYNEKIWHKF